MNYLIHRRVKSTYACSNELNIVRLGDCDVVDVDHDENYILPVNGRNNVGRFGGISISTFPINHDHNSNFSNPCFQREMGVDYPVYGPLRWQGTRITRFHCYRLRSNRLNSNNNPPCYDILSDDPPHHGLIVPVTPVKLVDVHQRPTDGAMVARFPQLRQCPWEFCCNLLQMTAQDYAIMRAGGQPKDLKDCFQDPKFVVLVNCLRLISCVVEECESSDQCFEVECWLLEHGNQMSFKDLYTNIPEKLFSALLSCLSLGKLLVDDADESDRIYDIETHLRGMQNFADTAFSVAFQGGNDITLFC